MVFSWDTHGAHLSDRRTGYTHFQSDEPVGAAIPISKIELVGYLDASMTCAGTVQYSPRPKASTPYYDNQKSYLSMGFGGPFRLRSEGFDFLQKLPGLEDGNAKRLFQSIPSVRSKGKA